MQVMACGNEPLSTIGINNSLRRLVTFALLEYKLQAAEVLQRIFIQAWHGNVGVWAVSGSADKTEYT